MTPTKFLWVDLEMTGLDPTKDVILEIAAEITDASLKTLASYESRVRQPRDIVIKRIQKNTWWQNYVVNRDDFLKNLEYGKPIDEIEEQLIRLIEKHFGDELAILSGNSIWNDRMFIKAAMPQLDIKLHYRMLDVSAWKVFMQANFDVEFKKPEVHRAFEDIQGSIAELQYYLDWFKKHGDKS